MGTIISSRAKDDGKIVFEISLDYAEAVQLKGYMDDVHIFSEKVSETEAKISQRGKNAATKYFLIPKQLRADLKFRSETLCQKIETKTKTIFIYTVDKIGL